MQYYKTTTRLMLALLCLLCRFRSNKTLLLHTPSMHSAGEKMVMPMVENNKKLDINSQVIMRFNVSETAAFRLIE